MEISQPLVALQCPTLLLPMVYRSTGLRMKMKWHFQEIPRNPIRERSVHDVSHREIAGTQCASSNRL